MFIKGVWEGFWWVFIFMIMVGCVYIIEYNCVDDILFFLLFEVGRYLIWFKDNSEEVEDNDGWVEKI